MATNEKQRQGAYRLEVPLDASGIKDFKPDRSVKVVAFDPEGRAQEETVKFDKNGKGAASFSFDGQPGRVKVVLGPENATADQLKGLQTISVDVLPRQWQNKRELTVNPVLIASYYWDWWWWWCRSYKITGKVVCANGRPVPGATVCAYDVDYWWWWWSWDQVGCATTDLNGAFEIDFTRCCGWWPWYWWYYRTWQLNPYLVDPIYQVLRQDHRFTKLPVPDPHPDLGIFQQLLAAQSSSNRPGGGELALRSAHVSRAAKFDPSTLDSLRTQLVKALPRPAQLGELRLWPWWPWYPWWDCDADIIFQVTQNCQGSNKVIVDETIWDTHWNIPTNFNINLTANDQACCGSQCNGECPHGNCLLPSDVCGINIGAIGGNEGAIAATPIGLLNPGEALDPGGVNGRVSYGADRPFAGALPLYGAFGDQTDVDYYELLVYYAGKATPTTPLPALPPLPPDKTLYTPLATPAFEGLDRAHLVFNPNPNWPTIPFHVQSYSDGAVNHNVIETIAHYEANNGAQLWDSASFNLLAVFNASGLTNGTYYLQMRSWKRPGYAGNLTNPQILPICGTENQNPPTNNYWVVTIDNQQVIALGIPPHTTDLNGIPCAGNSVHLCTTQPEAAILQVQIVHHDGSTTTVGACDNVCVVETDTLQVDFVAHDPDGYLAYYTLQNLYGASLFVDLLTIPGATLAPSPLPPGWWVAADQPGPDYGTALASEMVPNPPWWSGGAIRLRVGATLAFPETCAYTMQLLAHKRTIAGGGQGGCDGSFWNQYNVAEDSFTIVNPCPPSAIE